MVGGGGEGEWGGGETCGWVGCRWQLVDESVEKVGGGARGRGHLCVEPTEISIVEQPQRAYPLQRRHHPLYIPHQPIKARELGIARRRRRSNHHPHIIRYGGCRQH